MKAFVNTNCIGCEMCTVIAGKDFKFDESTLSSKVLNDIVIDESAAIDAEECCPVCAITIEK